MIWKVLEGIGYIAACGAVVLFMYAVWVMLNLFF